MMIALLSAALLGTSDFELLDVSLSATALVARQGMLTTQEEGEVVRRILANDQATMFLARHFGDRPTFADHLRLSLQHKSAGYETTGPAGRLSDLLHLRRSVVKYNMTQSVPDVVVTRALEAAILAPNHFLTEPWRFYEAGPATRAKLIAMNEAKAEAFSKVPGWMVVTVAASEFDAEGGISTKKGLEDHAAVACAVMNFMLSLAAEGVGTKWMTGALQMRPEDILDLVGADRAAERFMGVIWFGYPEVPLSLTVAAPTRKRGLTGVHRRLS